MNKKLKILESLPPMRCDRGCGDCCGPVPLTEVEFQRVRAYVQKHGVVPKDNGPLTCPFYQDGGCAVYPARPMVCRVYGFDSKLPCSRGYDVRGYERLVRAVILAGGQPTRMLHEFLETPSRVERDPAVLQTAPTTGSWRR